MTPMTTPTNEPAVGSAVQIRHELHTDEGYPDELAGLHGSIVGRDPFGHYMIKIGARKPASFARHAFVVTAAPGALPATTEAATTEAAPGQLQPTDHAAVRLVNQPPLAAINSTTNPRRRRGLDLDSLRALADSITAHGLAQPILVRPLPASRVEETSHLEPRPAYEVVAGERRWRAAQMAELPTMPMLVRDLTDGAVLEIQLVENIEREDIDPMEEAEGFALLREKLGYTVEQIAERMGKGRGPSYVRKRMKLLDLTPASREAMFDGTLQLSTGLLVSRYPADQQADAVRLIKSLERTGPHGERVPAPFREVVNALFRKFHLLLAQAPFDQEDPGLVMTAGPCSTCAKRTGTNADLFGEADQNAAASCTDVHCWEDKKTAHIQRAMADAKARGLKVMDQDEAAKLLPSPYSRYIDGYTPITGTAYTEEGDDETEREVTYADALRSMGRKAPKPMVVIHPHTGKVFEVIPDELAEQLEAMGEKNATPASQLASVGQPKAPAPLTPEEAKARAMGRGDVTRAVLYRLFDLVRNRPAGRLDDLRLIAEQVVLHGDERLHVLVEYMGWDDVADSLEEAEALREKIAPLNADQLVHLITMAAMEGALTHWQGRFADQDEGISYIEAQGIDILAVRDKVDEDLQRQRSATTATPSRASHSQGEGGADEDRDATYEEEAAAPADQSTHAEETRTAVGQADGEPDGRATSPDAGATQLVPGARVRLVGDFMTGKWGRLVRPLPFGDEWFATVDGLEAEYRFGPGELEVVSEGGEA